MGTGEETRPSVGARALTVFADARREIIGALIATLVAAVGGRLLGVTDQNIPLWLLGVTLILFAFALGVVVTVFRRQITIHHARTEAAHRSRQDAEARLTAMTQERDETRALLTQATHGSSLPASPEAQMIVRSARSLLATLAEAADRSGTGHANDAQKQAYEAVVEDAIQQWGDVPMLRAAAAVQTGYTYLQISELQTMLAQIDAYAMGAGNLPRRTT